MWRIGSIRRGFGGKMHIEQLWSAEDDRALVAFRASMTPEGLAAALLAIDGAPSAKARRCDETLNGWAERVDAVRQGDGPGAQATALRQVLGRELGFRGDEEDYYRPCNVRLSRVMKRKRGMPIMLSAIWMEVGRRAGISVEGLGMPGHFVARVGGPQGPMVDPFAGGARLTVQKCADIVSRLSNSVLPWQEHYLEAVGTDYLIERVLSNLSRCLRGACNPAGLYRIVRFQYALRPNDVSLPLVLAGLAEEVGAVRHAAAVLEQVLAERPDSAEARAAERWLPRLRARCGQLN